MLRFYLWHIMTLLCIARLLYNYERRIRHDRPFFRLSQASMLSREKFGFVSFTVGYRPTLSKILGAWIRASGTQQVGPR